MNTAKFCSSFLCSGFTKIVVLVLFIIPLAYISANCEPFHRGFFCSDQTLKHPYLSQTVSMKQCVLFWSIVTSVIIVCTEIIKYQEERRDSIIRFYPFKWLLNEILKSFGYFLSGAISCVSFSQLLKLSVGKLRPHFLTLCLPDLTRALCEDKWGYNRYVIEDEDTMCKGFSENNTTRKELNEARLSFVSVHSSFSFFLCHFLNCVSSS